MDILQAMTNISTHVLREAIKKEYAEVALHPHKEYHFHTGRDAANRIGYRPELYAGFKPVAILQYHAIFEDVPHPSSALEFGTKDVSLKAVKI